MATTASTSMPLNPVWRLLGWLSVLLLFFTTNVYAGQVSLAWNASTGASGYRVYQVSTNETAVNLSTSHVTDTSPMVADVPTSTATINNLADGKTYYYAVKAYNGTSVSGLSNEVGKTFPASPTPTPTPTPTPGAPVASFSANLTTGTAPLTVVFTDTSAGGTVTGWCWNFGEVINSTNCDPTNKSAIVTKTYADTGKDTNYTVSLTVSNAAGSSKAPTKLISVKAAPVVADFSANLTSGKPPLAVTFTNKSTGINLTGYSYSWNFGDGSSPSTEIHPAHTYTQDGSFTVSLTAKRPDGATITKSVEKYINVSSSSAGNAGLVAAYNFEEASGATVVDASGKGNNGTITEAARITSGKFGSALSFDGINDWVTVNDSASLDLTTGMTLEAWVYPTGAPSAWGTIAMKETTGNAVYGLFSDGTNSLPEAYMAGKSSAIGLNILPANTWAHLATTYNGSILVFYINGNEVRRVTTSGNITTSSGSLRIGGNSVWGDYFKGRIDEIRIYNSALSVREIQADMNKAVATSSPPKRLLGEQTLGSVSDSLPQGTAAAFQTTASVTGQITSLPVYVDTGSASTKLVAGLYADSSGRPGARLATGTLSSPKVGSWNTVLLPATKVTAGTKYWIAILSTSGTLKFRGRVGSTAQPSETSLSTSLTSLPRTWSTGTVSGNGPLSGYGAGY